MTTRPTITPLPPVPSRQDPDTFSDKADVFVSALPTFSDDMDDLADYLEALADDVADGQSSLTLDDIDDAVEQSLALFIALQG